MVRARAGGRRRACALFAAILLFGQLAVAAELMPGCSGNMAAALNPEQPLLCKAHGQTGQPMVKLLTLPH